MSKTNAANVVVNVNGLKLSGFNPNKMTLRLSGGKKAIMVHDLLSSLSKGEARKVRKALRGAGFSRMAGAERRPVGLANPIPCQPQRERRANKDMVGKLLGVPAVQSLTWTNPEPGIYLSKWFGIRRINGRFHLYQTDCWMPDDESLPHFVAKGSLKHCQEVAQQMIADRQSN
jgi:hypothetical protein